MCCVVDVARHRAQVSISPCFRNVQLDVQLDVAMHTDTGYINSVASDEKLSFTTDAAAAVYFPCCCRCCHPP